MNVWLSPREKVENFDSVVVSSELFDRIVKENSVDDLEFITYNVIVEGRTWNSIRYNDSPVIAVIDKILNRGAYTLFSRKVEDDIKSDILSNFANTENTSYHQSLDNDIVKLIDQFLDGFEDLSEDQRLINTIFILLSMFQKGLFLMSKYFPYLEDFKIYVGLYELLPFVEPARLRKYLKTVASEYFETLYRLYNIYGVKYKRPNYEIFLYSEKEDWDKIKDKFKSYRKKDEIFVFRFNVMDISTSVMYAMMEVNTITFVANKQNDVGLSREPVRKFLYSGGKAVVDENKSIEEDDLKYFLDLIFRLDNFRQGQLEGIVRTLKGKNTLLLLPTGAGKSLVYQLSAMLLPGLCVVVDPIKSLMDDQVESLYFRGITKTSRIHSDLEPQTRRFEVEKLNNNKVLFVFVSPERFETPDFKKTLESRTKEQAIPLVVVDEAHCVSEWGHDFRPSYLSLAENINSYCRNPDGNVATILALTGTASSIVLDDILRELGLSQDDRVVSKSFKRKELRFKVKRVNPKDKEKVMGEIFKELESELGIPANSLDRSEYDKIGIVFSILAKQGKDKIGVEALYEKLCALYDANPDELSSPIRVFTGRELDIRGLKAQGIEYEEYKRNVMIDFKRNKVFLVVSTKAFGMGIDNPNVRFTVHYTMPPSIESFYQEAGRAGRGLQESYCYLIASPYSNVDEEIITKLKESPEKEVREIASRYESVSDILLDVGLPYDTVVRIYEEVNSVKKILSESGVSGLLNGDVLNNFYLHTKSFVGKQREIDFFNELFSSINSKLGRSGTVIIRLSDFQQVKQLSGGGSLYSEDEGKNIHKVLYRLRNMGAIEEFSIRYLESFGDEYDEEYHVTVNGYDKESIYESLTRYLSLYFGESYMRNTKALANDKPYMRKFFEDYKNNSVSGVEFVRTAYKAYIEFVYDHIERARRRAMAEMYRACLDVDNFENRILSYLEVFDTSTFIDMKDQKDLGLEKATEMILQSSKDDYYRNQKFVGITARLLTDFPNISTFLLLRGFFGFYIGEEERSIDDMVSALSQIIIYIATLDADEDFKMKRIDYISQILLKMDKHVRNTILEKIYQKIKGNTAIEYFIELLRRFDPEQISEELLSIAILYGFESIQERLEYIKSAMEEVYGEWTNHPRSKEKVGRT